LKSDPESVSVSGTGSPPKVNQFFRLVGPIITPNFNEIIIIIIIIIILFAQTEHVNQVSSTMTR